MSARKILLLEDEAIIAMVMEMTLVSHGFEVLGPCPSVDDARLLAHEDQPDIAILDVNLGGEETSFAFALELHALGIPIIFVTGYSANTVIAPPPLRHAPRLTKPVSEADLISAVKSIGLP